jgi:carbonic anhydrase/acetyltransferase-like protein (isoleucine patch superfamily)
MAPEMCFRPELVHPSVFIASGVVVIGDVTIEEEASIWFNAVLRGDTTTIRVGKRSNIQDGCILHADPGFPCTLGVGVTLGHAAIVHGATIGDNVVIGMRSVVMNGAHVGENSIIGVGAVVTAGTKIPPGSLVLGLPAKVRRALTPAEIEGNRATADHYVRAAKQYLTASR